MQNRHGDLMSKVFWVLGFGQPIVNLQSKIRRSKQGRWTRTVTSTSAAWHVSVRLFVTVARMNVIEGVVIVLIGYNNGQLLLLYNVGLAMDV